jgi:hypothetical protein
MKKLFLILIASVALVMAHDFNSVYAGEHDGDGDGGIPLSKLAGKYSVTYQGGGFFTQCFKPDFSATESCSTPGAVPVNLYTATVGQTTWDKDGDSCLRQTAAVSTLGQPFPSTVVAGFSAEKVTDYDPATGSGDTSFTNYLGGKCIGSKFDSTGATVLETGTYHFVASDDGDRVDFAVTTFTDALGDLAGFVIAGSFLKQDK